MICNNKFQLFIQCHIYLQQAAQRMGTHTDRYLVHIVRNLLKRQLLFLHKFTPVLMDSSLT